MMMMIILCNKKKEIKLKNDIARFSLLWGAAFDGFRLVLGQHTHKTT